MTRPKLEIEMRGPVHEDIFLAAIRVEPTPGGGSADWAELYLENVNEDATGQARIADARVVIRMWVDETPYDFPYDDAVSALASARRRLLEGEAKVHPLQA